MSCSVFGDYYVAAGEQGIFVASSVAGAWGKAQQLPGSGTSEDGAFGGVLAASCWAAGYCSVGGAYGFKDTSTPFISDEAAGTWAGAAPALHALIDGQAQFLSCVPGFCVAAIGRFGGSSRLVMQATEPVPQLTTTAEALSRTTVTYGQETTEKISVAVTAKSGIPSGSVTVNSGNTAICRITLRSGRGTCVLTARQLKPGTYSLVAVYGGSGGYLRSVSARVSLRVGA